MKRHYEREEEELPVDEETMETMRAAALLGKSTFPDQIDYYDPETDEIV